MNCHDAKTYRELTAAGSLINLCPFGCEDYELDERGYCHHLIGFAIDENAKEGSEMELARQTLKKTNRKGDEEDDKRIKVTKGRQRLEDGTWTKLERIQPGDTIQQITFTQKGESKRNETVNLFKSPRVYRNKPEPAAKPNKKAPEAALAS